MCGGEMVKLKPSEVVGGRTVELLPVRPSTARSLRPELSNNGLHLI